MHPSVPPGRSRYILLRTPEFRRRCLVVQCGCCACTSRVITNGARVLRGQVVRAREDLICICRPQGGQVRCYRARFFSRFSSRFFSRASSPRCWVTRANKRRTRIIVQASKNEEKRAARTRCVSVCPRAFICLAICNLPLAAPPCVLPPTLPTRFRPVVAVDHMSNAGKLPSCTPFTEGAWWARGTHGGASAE